MSATLTVCADPADLAARAADLFVAEARDAVARAGRFAVALSGGSTPEKMYGLLAARAGDVDWNRVLIFLGDERFVPLDDPRGNFALARRALLDHLDVPARNVHPVPVHLPTPAAAAEAYAATLASTLGSGFPAFDLIFLGLGDDGHCASLFPGRPALHIADRTVTSSPPGVLPPPVDRVTFTFPLINAAHHVAFLVAGAGKAGPLRDILEGTPSVNDRPAAGVRPATGRLSWLVDEAAAGQLTRR